MAIMEIQAKSIPPDSRFKKEQLIIGGGRLQQAWAFEQPASRRERAAFEGAGQRSGLENRTRP